ncbi:MAG: RDD family protein [Promethearchaeota archaeon]
MRARFVAYSVDAIITLSITIFILSFIPESNLPLNSLFLVIFIGIWWLLGTLYFCLFEYYNNGKTPGKAIVQIRTIDKKTKDKLNPESVILNNISKCNPIFFSIDVLIGLIKYSGLKENILRATQKMANTIVIKTD